MMHRIFTLLAAIALLAMVLSACAPAATPTRPVNPTMILATTTSTQDSGLLDVLIPAFEQATGYTVQVVAVGSGAALKMGEEGNADVLLVHSPAAEKAFMDNGFGTDRRLVMHNYYIIVGPASDPAGIKSATSTVEAFQKVAASGTQFISRGDGSGTTTMELALWKKADITPAGQAWYVETGQGMGPTLTIASEKGAYTLTDRATFLANQGNLQLDMLYQNDSALLNAYHVIVVNHDKWPNSNLEGAIAFADFVTSPAGQAIIDQYGVEKFGQQLFIPDAGKTDADLGLP
jgi:tungstate transport system substrate-binding protein